MRGHEKTTVETVVVWGGMRLAPGVCAPGEGWDDQQHSPSLGTLTILSADRPA